MFIREIWGELTSFIFEILKSLSFHSGDFFFFFFFFQKSELGKFIPNFLLTHVITSTNISDKQIYLTSTSLVNIEKVSLPKGNRYLYLGVPPSSLKCMQGHMPKYKHLLSPGSV